MAHTEWLQSLLTRLYDPLYIVHVYEMHAGACAYAASGSRCISRSSVSLSLYCFASSRSTFVSCGYIRLPYVHPLRSFEAC